MVRTMTERRTRAGLTVAVVAGVATILSGCVESIDLRESEESVADPYGLYDMLDYEQANQILVAMDTWGVEAELSGAQLAELADGTVTEEEYQASFERYRSCLREAGYELENIHTNGPFVGYSTPAAAVETGVDDECYFREYFATWDVWTGIHTEENERQNRIHRCAGENGLDTSTESGHPMPLADMERLLVEAGVDLETC